MLFQSLLPRFIKKKNHPSSRGAVKVSSMMFSELLTFKYGKHKNAEDDDADEEILSFRELFLKEDSREEQGNHAYAGDNGRSDCSVTAHRIYVCKLACCFAYGGADLVALLGKLKLNLLKLHKGEEDKTANCKGQFVRNVCDKLNVLLGYTDERAALHFEEDYVEEAAERINKGVAEGHQECDKSKALTVLFLSCYVKLGFVIAYTDNADYDKRDSAPYEEGDTISKEDNA